MNAISTVVVTTSVWQTHSMRKLHIVHVSWTRCTLVITDYVVEFVSVLTLQHIIPIIWLFSSALCILLHMDALMQTTLVLAIVSALEFLCCFSVCILLSYSVFPSLTISHIKCLGLPLLPFPQFLFKGDHNGLFSVFWADADWACLGVFQFGSFW